jgi:hypothetical protein
MGRPSTFKQKIADEICERLSKGEPLAAICRDAHMPSDWTVRQWADAEKPFIDADGSEISFAIAYARARDVGFDTLALEGLSLLDEEPERVVTISGEDRSESRIDSASVQRAKNRFEGRLKLLAKWDPKRYGDLLKLSGSDGTGPVPVVSLSADMTAAQAAEAYAKLLG